ncbi:hypothetical protein Lal_00026922 [Lupinus albus]|nr:hypothetical protein Lal_00026922 [Lupinus albus]
MFTSLMEANKQYPEGRTLGYAQYVSKFVYLKKSRCWKPRKSRYTIGRLIWVSTCTGELYYLRMMLRVVKGLTYYEGIRIVSNIRCATFHALIWGLVLTDEQLQNLTLMEIEKLLERNRRSLKDYPSMPFPYGYITSQLGNRLIYEELNYDTGELKKNFNTLFNSLRGSHVFPTSLWRNWKNAYVANSNIYIEISKILFGIASLLLRGVGQNTLNSKFLHQLLTTLCATSIKAPTTHKFCFKALDNSLGDIKVIGTSLMGLYQSWDPRLSERFSVGRERFTWEDEILGYTGGFSPERESSRLGEKWHFGTVETVRFSLEREDQI